MPHSPPRGIIIPWPSRMWLKADFSRSKAIPVTPNHMFNRGSRRPRKRISRTFSGSQQVEEWTQQSFLYLSGHSVASVASSCCLVRALQTPVTHDARRRVILGPALHLVPLTLGTTTRPGGISPSSQEARPHSPHGEEAPAGAGHPPPLLPPHAVTAPTASCWAQGTRGPGERSSLPGRAGHAFWLEAK